MPNGRHASRRSTAKEQDLSAPTTDPRAAVAADPLNVEVSLTSHRGN
jgi:hypothetical protein